MSNVIKIIVPSYNCKQVFKATFDSVLSQTYKDWEWIIVDDCSTDGSYEYIKELSKDDERIVVLQTPKNGGTAVARNIGLKHASGRYITFLDSDDLLDPNYLEEQIKFIKDNGPIISAGYRRQAEHTCTDFYVPKENTYKSLLKGCPLSCLTTMYDREIVGDVYFPENMKRVEDYTFWLDILKRGYVAKGNQQILATYIIGKNSKSRNKFKLIKYYFHVYHKTQGFNWFKSWFYVFRWALCGLKKYKGVK